MTDQTIQTQNEQPESVPVEAVVLKLLELAQQWNDTADKVDRDWYNDSAAYRECADELSDFVKELTAGAESKSVLNGNTGTLSLTETRCQLAANAVGRFGRTTRARGSLLVAVFRTLVFTGRTSILEKRKVQSR